MSRRKGPPKHRNKFAWKPNAGRKINETEAGGKFRPYSEVTGVCQRCKEQIEWKRKYGKYKPLTEPAKNVRNVPDGLFDKLIIISVLLALRRTKHAQSVRVGLNILLDETFQKWRLSRRR